MRIASAYMKIIFSIRINQIPLYKQFGIVVLLNVVHQKREMKSLYLTSPHTSTNHFLRISISFNL